MKKCLVLDLDNTLWGGVVGEDGIENLALSTEYPGSGYLAFQQAILDHYHRGVILALNSKNNPDDALSVIRTHPSMLLKENHFASMRLNWNSKADNLSAIAQELHIGLDSIVFLDDDHHNRELVRALLPEVFTPDLPNDPKDYASFLHGLGCFPSSAITNEDALRGNFFVTERLRTADRKKKSSREEYLQNLSLTLHIGYNDESAIDRIAQLTEKTNQFNTDKKPLTPDQVATIMQDPSQEILTGRLVDAYGDYGIIAVAIITKDGVRWIIEQFIVSCRALDLSVEHALLSEISNRAAAAGVHELVIKFIKTEKNTPAETFVRAQFDAAGLRSNISPDAVSHFIKLHYE